MRVTGNAVSSLLVCMSHVSALPPYTCLVVYSYLLLYPPITLMGRSIQFAMLYLLYRKLYSQQSYSSSCYRHTSKCTFLTLKYLFLSTHVSTLHVGCLLTNKSERLSNTLSLSFSLVFYNKIIKQPCTLYFYRSCSLVSCAHSPTPTLQIQLLQLVSSIFVSCIGRADFPTCLQVCLRTFQLVSKFVLFQLVGHLFY